MRGRSASSWALFVVLLGQPSLSGQGASANLNFPVVACRMPMASATDPGDFPDAGRMSLRVGHGTDLVRIDPGTSGHAQDVVLFSAGTVGACVDPFVSHDGKTIYFTYFEDAQSERANGDETKIPTSPAHIYRLDVASGHATQLTFGDEVAWPDTARAVDNQVPKFDLTPIELPDGRILFLSNREAVTSFNWNERFPAMRFFVMNPDGTGIEPLENFTQGSCEHPIILQDGRIVWTHVHSVGRRAQEAGNYPLMVANPDMADIKTFAGAHDFNAAYHFIAQLSGGDIVSTVYYHKNNYGHGSFIRFPVDPTVASHGSDQDFTPLVDPSGTAYYYDSTDHFRRVDQDLLTPLTKVGDLLTNDWPSVNGKVTMPAAAPIDGLLCIYSPTHTSTKSVGSVGPEAPHMKVCYLPSASTASVTAASQLLLVRESATYHYLYPRALVTYQDIYGQAAPDNRLPAHLDPKNDGVVPVASALATTGTSSVYNRESAWVSDYPDEWSFVPGSIHNKNMPLFRVGQDTYRFPDSEIHAAQVVADMSHYYRRESSGVEGMRSHNHGSQVWGILGEVPVRKTSSQGAEILDDFGDPDTSYEVLIPADTPFHNRILDENGLTLTSEWTWHSARPSERKNNCGGCHAHSTDREALSFSTTFAGSSPLYQVDDLARETPIMTVDDDGIGRTFVDTGEKIRIVEYHEHVKPLLDANCASCHTGTSPAGALNLDQSDNDQRATGLTVWEYLAFDDTPVQIQGLAYPQHQTHQATRWIRKHAATQSLLVWKLFDARLDGRNDGDRAAASSSDPDASFHEPMFGPTYVDHGSLLTFDEKRLVGQWIDLGCLVDENPNDGELLDPFDDQMKPTLVVRGLPNGYADPGTGQAFDFTVAAYDLHSDLDAGSLAASVRVGDGAWTALTMPALPTGGQEGTATSSVSVSVAGAIGRTHTVEVEVADEVALYDGSGTPFIGRNVARRSHTFIPIDDPSGPNASTIGEPSAGTAVKPQIELVGTPSLLQSVDVKVTTTPNSFVLLYFDDALASWRIPLAFDAANPTGATNAYRYLEELDFAAPIANGLANGAGVFTFTVSIPNDPSLVDEASYYQAVVYDPTNGLSLAPGVGGAISGCLRVIVGP